jgi:serine kinase of HPr protein (carbohydrate metabolism regulator)
LDLILETFAKHLKIHIAEMARHRVFVHAGAVEWHGRGIMIPGRSFSGKTSLVAELIKAGATYYSDEYAVLDRQGRMHPFSAPLAVRQPDSIRQNNVSPEELGGGTGIKPLSVSLVILSQYVAGEEWHPRQLTPGQAMLELLNNTIPARRRPEAAINTLQKVVGKATTLKGVRGEASQTAKLIFNRLVNKQ